jgi:hypothetical protein
VQEKRTKGPALPLGWRARVLGCILARGRRTHVVTRANANASAKYSEASRSRAARHGVRWREGKARPESERALTKAAAPTNEFDPAWHEGRHHQRRRGGAERLHVPPRFEGRGVHKGREVVVLTLVATGRSAGVSEVRWRGSSAGRKTKVAAARRRGSRGSRGSRCSRRRRVRLLPRAAPVFAADGAPTDGSSPPSPPFTSLLLRRVGVWTWC